MARSIDQITAELNKYTDSTRQNVLSALAELPTQQAAQESGLRAQLADANDQILAGARRRGLGFSGIPLGDQAKYAATEFAPALARNAAQFSERRMTLQDALSNLDRQNYLQANDIYNQELQREEQKRQFDLNYAMQQRASAGGGGGPGLSFGGGVQRQPVQQTQAPKTDPVQQDAFNDVYSRITTLSPQEIISDYNATKVSAGYGNVRDKYKLQLYAQLRPDLFRGIAAQALGNGGRLTF